MISELTKNHQGRYTLPNGEYLTTDDDIMFKLKENWVTTRVHHDLTDYYLVDYPNVPMEGLTAKKPYTIKTATNS